MDTWLIIVLVIVALIVLGAVFVGMRRQKESKLTEQRVEAGEHREQAETRSRQAEVAEAEAEERAARAKREQLAADEQAERAERERASAQELHERAREVDPDVDSDDDDRKNR